MKSSASVSLNNQRASRGPGISARAMGDATAHCSSLQLKRDALRQHMVTDRGPLMH
jgi:hypothetical protein